MLFLFEKNYTFVSKKLCISKLELTAKNIENITSRKPPLNSTKESIIVSEYYQLKLSCRSLTITSLAQLQWTFVEVCNLSSLAGVYLSFARPDPSLATAMTNLAQDFDKTFELLAKRQERATALNLIDKTKLTLDKVEKTDYDSFCKQGGSWNITVFPQVQAYIEELKSIRERGDLDNDLHGEVDLLEARLNNCRDKWKNMSDDQEKGKFINLIQVCSVCSYHNLR